MSSGEQTHAHFVPTVPKTRQAATARPAGSGTPAGGELAGVPSSMLLAVIGTPTLASDALPGSTIASLPAFAVVSLERPSLDAQSFLERCLELEAFLVAVERIRPPLGAGAADQ
jgi:hypothetical protein